MNQATDQNRISHLVVRSRAHSSSRRFVEPGAAFSEIAEAESRETTSEHTERVDGSEREQTDVVVIGAGQAGLSVGYHLAAQGLSFVILDAAERVGDSWRKRWDSLRLFTPARYDGLDGMRFPAPGNHFPTKDEMADYLEAYAERFDLPVRTGVRVERVHREESRYVVRTSSGVLEAGHVVVAMANYQHKKTPAFAADLDPRTVQIHSADYRNPSQLKDGSALIIGAGNSGSEIARELAADRQVWLSGRRTGHLPFRIGGLLGRLLLVRLVLRFFFHRILTVETRLGRKLYPTITKQGGPLIRVMPKDLARMGVEWVPKTAGVEGGRPRLEDGRVLDVANIIWCTGFHPGFSWIDLPILGDDGKPVHRGGVVETEPGLYFVGLHFFYSVSSAMIHGVGRDARRIVQIIASRQRTARPASRRPVEQTAAS